MMNPSRIGDSAVLLACFFLLPGISSAQSAPSECDATSYWKKTPKFNSCREDRETVHGAYRFYKFGGQVPPHGAEVAVHCTLSAPHRPCFPGEADCSEEPFEYDKVAWARQQCNIRNNVRKLDLWNCVEDGIYFSKNSAEESCDKKDVYIHRRSQEGSSNPCDLLNAKNELVDIGNSAFYSCQAQGPGPAGLSNVNQALPNGCCLLGSQILEAPHWQIQKNQYMLARLDLVWTERYLEKWALLNIEWVLEG